jgi:cobalt-zinc-cadmium efflux system protein
LKRRLLPEHEQPTGQGRLRRHDGRPCKQSADPSSGDRIEQLTFLLADKLPAPREKVHETIAYPSFSMSREHWSLSRGAGRLKLVAVLVVAYMLVEIVAGLLTGSLALISDAAHMGTDALGLGMALAAVMAGPRRGRSSTYGLYRLEILAALANTVLLFGVGGYVIFEAISRWSNPPEVMSGPMLAVAAVGLAVNLAGWKLLDAPEASLNIQGARVELMSDLAGSVGVLAAALLIKLTGWLLADPLFAVAIGLFILPRAWRLGKEAVRILVQAAPPHLDVDRIRTTLAALPGVVDIHDLHVWTLTSGMEVASAHLMIGNDRDPHDTLDGARDVLQRDFHIAHATLQVEPEAHTGCTELNW